MICKENFKGMKFLWNSFDVIKTVHSDNQLHTLELLFQNGYSLLDLFFLESFGELFGVDTDGESAHGDDLAFEFHSVWCRGEIEDARTTAEKVSCIVVRMKADEIAVQNTEKDFISNGKNSIDLAGGERCVQEKANLDIGFGRSDLFPEHLW